MSNPIPGDDAERVSKLIKLTDPVLDASDGPTRLLLLAEYWKREAIKARAAAPSTADVAADIALPRAAFMTGKDLDSLKCWYSAEQMLAFRAAGAPAETAKAVGEATAMPGTSGYTMVCFKATDVPVGTKLYTAPANAPDVANDAARLDFVLEQCAWIQWATHDDTFKRCQLWTQDEDENYIVLSGDEKSFATEREAIDAAMGALPPAGGEAK